MGGRASHSVHECVAQAGAKSSLIRDQHMLACHDLSLAPVLRNYALHLGPLLTCLPVTMTGQLQKR